MSTSAELDRRRLRDGAPATFRALPYDDPVSQDLIERVQQEYVQRYGGPDEAVVDPAEFLPPHGLFLVAEVDGVPAGCGGGRGVRGPLPGDKRGVGGPRLRRPGLG